MRIQFLIAIFALLLGGCSGSLYPESIPLIQDEMTAAAKEKLVHELEARDPPARLMFGMMEAKTRCDVFWQQLEQERTAGDIAFNNLQYINNTITPVLAGSLSERAVANTIWAIGLAAEFVKSRNELALLSVDKYRSALREKTEEKQLTYYTLNKDYAESLLARGPNYPWTRFESDEVNFRIYSYARLCTRPELMMTFDQLITQGRVVADHPGDGVDGSRSRSRRLPSGRNDLPGFAVVR